MSICQKLAAKISEQKLTPEERSRSAENYKIFRSVGHIGGGPMINSAEQQYPGSTFSGLCVRTDFYTDGDDSITYISAIYIGRTKDGEKVVVLHTESDEWQMLSRSNPAADHNQLIIDTAGRELDRLTDKITQAVRNL